MKWLRFSQLGTRKPKNLMVCDCCAALVREQDITAHARYHAASGDLVDDYPSPGITENSGDRMVRFTDEIAEVRAT